MIKPFWSQFMAPWAPVVAYEQGRKITAKPRTDLKLWTSSHRVGTWTSAGVTATMLRGMYCVLPPVPMEPQSKRLYTSVAMTPATVWVPTLRPLVPSFMSVIGLVKNFPPCLHMNKVAIRWVPRLLTSFDKHVKCGGEGSIPQGWGNGYVIMRLLLKWEAFFTSNLQLLTKMELKIYSIDVAIWDQYVEME